MHFPSLFAGVISFDCALIPLSEEAVCISPKPPLVDLPSSAENAERKREGSSGI